MKAVVVAFGLLLGAGFAHAEIGFYEEALSQTLKSDSLKDVRAQLDGLELTETKTEKISQRRNGPTEYKVSLFYSALGTAGGCFVDAKVVHSQMELVKPGGGGFEIRNHWDVTAARGLCPR